MSTRNKTFDCVRMKNEIQEKLRKERAGMTDEQIREQIQKELATSNDPIAVWWRNLMAEKQKKAS